MECMAAGAQHPSAAPAPAVAVAATAQARKLAALATLTAVRRGERPELPGPQPPAVEPEATAALASTPNVREEFDWILDFRDIKGLLEPEALQVDHGSALVVGCGRSSLSRQLAESGFYSRVVSVDNDPAVIEAMRQMDPDLQWVCADCCSQEAMTSAWREAGAALGAQSEQEESGRGGGGPFAVVIDKGTLDAVLCEGKAPELLAECYRALKPGGVYACVSLRARGLLERLLGQGSPCDWSYEAHWVLPAQEEPAAAAREGPPTAQFTLALLRKPLSSAAPLEQPDLVSLRAHCEAVQNEFFTEQAPLLTPEREAELCAAVAAHLAAAGDQEALRLEEAYTLLFTEAERAEYSLEGFLEDAAASADRRIEPSQMTLLEALAFVRENQ